MSSQRFGFLYLQRLALGRLPPIDQRCRIARLRGPELPKIIALTGAAAAMDARGLGSDAAGLGDNLRQTRRQGAGC